MVLRVPSGGTEAERRREVALQDAAGRFAGLAPRVRAVGTEDAWGGTFFVMDRLAGGPLWHWLHLPFLLSIPFAIWAGQAWIVLAIFLISSGCVAFAMAGRLRQLREIQMEDIDTLCADYGLKDEDLTSHYWLDAIAWHINEFGLSGFDTGYRWLASHEVAAARPGLCLGDFHPGNFLGTWTHVSGLVDWEMACIADVELDIGSLRFIVTLLGPILLPVYWAFRLRLWAAGRYDTERLRYYESLRTLLGISIFAGRWVQHSRQQLAGEDGTEPMPRWLWLYLSWALGRRFRKLTGVALKVPQFT